MAASAGAADRPGTAWAARTPIDPLPLADLHSPGLALVRLLTYVTICLVLVPPMMVVRRVNWTLALTIARKYHSLCCWLSGFRITVHGDAARAPATLFVANHASYFDIPVLGSLLRASFIAKAEVATWPGFGFLARLQRTVFIERVRSRAGDQRSQITDRLADGDQLVLFAEGTSNNGTHVLPFKSALFAVAEAVDGRPVLVQPVSIAYTRTDGIPLGRTMRHWFAWYGDTDLAPHFWGALGLGTTTVEVVFHAPVTLDQFPGRKAMAEHCQRVVAAGVGACNSGRLDRLPAPRGPGRPGCAAQAQSQGQSQGQSQAQSQA